jgi:DMSO/TMAO reductase YedYZ molybdopterin-dependent catalytic subunit
VPDHPPAASPAPAAAPNAAPDSSPRDSPRRRLAGWALSAAAGLASVVLGLGLAELTAAFVAPQASPVLVVGSQLIDWAPAWAKQTAIALFGTGDKAALLTGIALVLVIVSGVAGALERWKSPIGRIIIGAAGVFGVGAAIARSGSSPADIIPAVVATVVALITLGYLLRKLDERPRARPVNPATLRATGSARPPTSTAEAAAAQRQEAERLSRRRFIGLSAGAVVIGALATAGGYALEAGARAAAAARNALKLPAPATKAAAVPAGAELDIPGLASVVSSNDQFYRIDTALQVPQIDPTQWELKIIGMVEKPVTLTFAELLALPLEESYTTLMCVSNDVGGNLIGNAKWLGYPIRHLLARAKPTASADMVLSRSSDGFTASTPLSVLQEDDRNAILAVGMNGDPLPPEHGYPVRMVVPGLYGYVSATKWVVELEVTRFADRTAYWTDRGWSSHGPVKLESRIDVPRAGANVKGGRVVVAGVAWHQHTGIQKVEVRVDGGEWNEAELATAISADTWVQWRWDWDAPSGQHKLEVRATDATGSIQTSDVADTVPNGATGYHTIPVSIG